MTVTFDEAGQLVLPPEAREAARVRPGDEYHIMVSTSGSIMLRPRRKHRKSLLEHLQGLNGLKIERRRDPVPEPSAL